MRGRGCEGRARGGGTKGFLFLRRKKIREVSMLAVLLLFSFFFLPSVLVSPEFEVFWKEGEGGG